MVNGGAVILAITTLLQPQQWAVGAEREVDEGVYMQVVSSQHGWRIWKVETRSGTRCKAVKSAVGRPHPVPVGVSSMMSRGTPFLEAEWEQYRNRFTYRWGTTHYGKVRIKYRPMGDRFWEERDNFSFNADEIGEQRIEVLLTSWEYPEILVGHAEEAATFDLAGLAWAQAQVNECEGVRAGEQTVSWLRMPSPEFPEAAFSQGVSEGRVELDCAAGSDGSLSSCTIVSETPANVGFGQAALVGVRRARVATRGTPPADGDGRIKFAIRFAAPPSTSPPTE